MKTSFSSEHTALSYVFAALVTLASVPVTAWHYLSILSGLGVLAVVGLALADCVLWTAAHWSTKVHSGAMRAVCISIKLALGGLMLLNAGAVLATLQSERRTVETARLAGDLRAAEIRERGEVAAKLAGVAGGRRAAAEAMRLSEGVSVATISGEQSSRLAAIVPAWYSDFGVFCVPALAGLVAFGVLTVAATICRRRETLAEILGETEMQSTEFVSPCPAGSVGGGDQRPQCGTRSPESERLCRRLCRDDTQKLSAASF
jgi:hypothetical protein